MHIDLSISYLCFFKKEKFQSNIKYHITLSCCRILGPLLRIFTKHMLDVVSGTQKKKRKIYLFSGHESNIAAVLHALDLYYPHVPEYSSSIIVELHNIEGTHYVKVCDESCINRYIYIFLYESNTFKGISYKLTYNLDGGQFTILLWTLILSKYIISIIINKLITMVNNEIYRDIENCSNNLRIIPRSKLIIIFTNYFIYSSFFLILVLSPAFLIND